MARVVDADALWERFDQPGLFCVEGEVLLRGKPMRLNAIIRHRWGWPKRAADEAAEHLRTMAAPRRVVLWLNEPERRQQQEQILRARPEILRALLGGLAQGSSHPPHNRVQVRTFSLDLGATVVDSGLLGAILEAVAHRVGVTMEWMRAHSFISLNGTDVRVEIHGEELDLEELTS